MMQLNEQTRLILTFPIWIVLAISLASYTATAVYGQTAENAQGDLWGENWGDRIALWWSKQKDIDEYVVYRGTSIRGPWKELFRATNVYSGARIDRTSDASIMALCYRIEAYGRKGQLIEDQLPPSLRSLAYRNGIQVRPDPDFHGDMDRLIKGIEPHLSR